jgi:hypothetical protein
VGRTNAVAEASGDGGQQLVAGGVPELGRGAVRPRKWGQRPETGHDAPSTISGCMCDGRCVGGRGAPGIGRSRHGDEHQRLQDRCRCARRSSMPRTVTRSACPRACTTWGPSSRVRRWAGRDRYQHRDRTAAQRHLRPERGQLGRRGAQATSATLTGLSPASADHARLVATAPDGTAASTDVTFTTASPPTPLPPLPSPRGSRRPGPFRRPHLTRSRFRVAGQATAVSARKSRAGQGTTVQFTLSTAARLSLVSTHGHRAAEAADDASRRPRS